MQPNKFLCNPSVSNAFSAAATNLPPVAQNTSNGSSSESSWQSERTSIVLQKVLHHFIGTLCASVQHPSTSDMTGDHVNRVCPAMHSNSKHFAVLYCKTCSPSIHHGYLFPPCSPSSIKPKHECERSITTFFSMLEQYRHRCLYMCFSISENMGLSENSVPHCTQSFADHYPY